MLKKIRFILISLCLSLLTIAAPLIANTSCDKHILAQAPEKAEHPEPPQDMNRPLPPNDGKCKPCKRPFKRLVTAMHELKKSNLMSEDEFKKAFDALMKIPKETFKDTKDMDQTAADTLYKGKVLTAEQYKKICTFLKDRPANR